jgi:hypothetical protein
MNNDRLIFLKVQSVVDPLQPSQACNRNGSGTPEIKRLGDVSDSVRGYHNILRIKAAFSDLPLERIHFVAHLETPDTCSNRSHRSGAVRSQNNRKSRSAERPPAGPYGSIPGPNSGSMHRDQNFVSSDGRDRKSVEFQHIRSAKTINGEGAHIGGNFCWHPKGPFLV